jgi:hypothetical protein
MSWMLIEPRLSRFWPVERLKKNPETVNQPVTAARKTEKSAPVSGEGELPRLPKPRGVTLPR